MTETSKSDAAHMRGRPFGLGGFWTLAAGQGFMRGEWVFSLRLTLMSEDEMTVTLYAQPYNIEAQGFYFESVEEYERKAAACVDAYGNAVEEFEIQFIDGDAIDGELARAFGLYQSTLEPFFDAVVDYDDHEKQKLIIALLDLGYRLTASTTPNDFDIDIYYEESLKDLAIQFVDEGLFGEVPPCFQFYIDYDAIARDLAVDYTETTIAGEYLIYRAA